MATQVTIKAPRQSNMELLRILSMLMIITLHLMRHGGVLGAVQPGTYQYYLSWVLEGLSYVAVNCYVLLSGYFGCESGFKLKKLILLLAQIFLYSAVLYFILVAFGQVPFSRRAVLVSLFPTLSSEYWFATVYVGLYILSPFLNTAIKAMTKEQHFISLIVMIGLFSVIPYLVPFAAGLYFGDGTGIVWFIVLYWIGAFIKKYYTPTQHAGGYAMKYLLFAVLVPLIKFLLDQVPPQTLAKFVVLDNILDNSGVFFSYNSLFVLLASVYLLMAFVNVKSAGPRLGRLITSLSALTFGVYLIHDNRNLRPILWKFLQMGGTVNEWAFPFYFLLAILGIYAACSLIDFLRSILFLPFAKGKGLDTLCAWTEKTLKSKITGSRLYQSFK